jgi:hypothetical protein
MSMLSKVILIGLLLFNVGVSFARGNPRLFLVAPEPYVGVGSPVLLDIYLYNDVEKPVKLRPLTFVSANWTLIDTSGKKKEARAGISSVASDHGTPDIIVPGGAVLYERTKLDVGAEAGDVVEIKVHLGKGKGLESNTVCLYYK